MSTKGTWIPHYHYIENKKRYFRCEKPRACHFCEKEKELEKEIKSAAEEPPATNGMPALNRIGNTNPNKFNIVNILRQREGSGLGLRRDKFEHVYRTGRICSQKWPVLVSQDFGAVGIDERVLRGDMRSSALFVPATPEYPSCIVLASCVDYRYNQLGFHRLRGPGGCPCGTDWRLHPSANLLLEEIPPVLQIKHGEPRCMRVMKEAPEALTDPNLPTISFITSPHTNPWENMGVLWVASRNEAHGFRLGKNIGLLHSAEWSPDVGRFLVGHERGAVLYLPNQPDRNVQLPVRGQAVLGARFGPTPFIAYTASASGVVFGVDTRCHKNISRLEINSYLNLPNKRQQEKPCSGCIEVINGGSQVLCGYQGHETLLWDVRMRRVIHKYMYLSSTKKYTSFGIDLKDRFLYTVGDEGVYIWDIQGGQLVRRFSSHQIWHHRDHDHYMWHRDADTKSLGHWMPHKCAFSSEEEPLEEDRVSWEAKTCEHFSMERSKCNNLSSCGGEFLQQHDRGKGMGPFTAHWTLEQGYGGLSFAGMEVCWVDCVEDVGIGGLIGFSGKLAALLFSY